MSTESRFVSKYFLDPQLGFIRVRLQEQTLACNRHYLDALAVVDDPAPALQQLRRRTEPTWIGNRSFAGFNPARRDDLRLCAAVMEGDYIARGFRNCDIRHVLFGADMYRRSVASGHLLKRLHVRKLIAKIPRTRRWRITENGRALLGRAIQLYSQTWPGLAAA